MQEQGFFASLFDVSFSSFITTRIIKVLYILAIVVFALVALSYVIAAFAADVLLGLVVLIVFAPLGFLLWVIYSRVLLEVVMVLFRIMETNTELVVLQRGSQTSAPSYSPPPYSPPSSASPPPESPPESPPTGPTGQMPPPPPPTT